MEKGFTISYSRYVLSRWYFMLPVSASFTMNNSYKIGNSSSLFKLIETASK
ncbi:hypothetical protein CHCC14820_0896 [Bacillus paralicheniformis]|uniref:Uncharacterized protein n=1 Tax=Bacillus paralicheniformis TaxID=1648923 RepID=A0ABY3FXH7_9BACI|nr:hypothetical protein SC10_B2orf00199 [Bacillus paralicheniformis]OLG01816.1 hypothetical protein B4123_4400 [Bacillus paralicheniformis]OLG02906.1 hypothetical protein B4125_3785 [Bacillus paralicheniformis]TWJ54098.1 hypothetical protein CHCC5023_3648 [Bacillus paralicheniformis]TWJ59471.1 hypothetical protein CHCC5022_3520 [Bacillus paralicheniformis]